ncbi:MAG: glycosyltransferase family 39 protein [Planctomycetes bacterium]|nr:glycosyltransferase family 39 protein [Planctomycetota bacterium]
MDQKTTGSAAGYYAIVVLTAIALYSATLAAGFVSDDRPLILESSRIHSLSEVSGYFLEPFSQKSQVGRSAQYYRPVVSTSFAVDYAIGGPRGAWWFHLTNMMAYGACAAAVFALLMFLTDNRDASFFGAIGFVVLPVHVSSVCWISGRTDIFALLFAAMAFLCLLEGRATERRPTSWFLLAFIFSLLAMFSKEVALVLIGLWAVFEIAMGRKERFNAGVLRRAFAGGVLVCATVIYLIFRWRAIGALGAGDAARNFDVMSLEGIATICRCLLSYLGKLALPVHLSFGYEFDPYSILSWEPIGMLIGGGVLALITVYALVRRPLVGFGLSWIWLGLIPALNLVPINEIVAERFLFLPSVGFCLLLAVALMDITQKSNECLSRAAMIAGTILIIGWATRAVAAIPIWRSQRTLYLSTLRTAPTRPLSHVMTGEIYLDEVPVCKRAAVHYRAGLRYAEDRIVVRQLAHTQLGKIYSRKGDLFGASCHLSRAYRLNPTGRGAADELAGIYVKAAFWCLGQMNDPRRALAILAKAEKMDSDARMLHYLKGVALAQLGKLEDARDALIYTTRKHPDLAVAHRQLAVVYEKMGKLGRALREAEHAFKIDRSPESETLVERIKEKTNLR